MPVKKYNGFYKRKYPSKNKQLVSKGELKKYVKKTLDAHIEDKYNYILFQSAVDDSGTIYQLMNNITQGTQDFNNRIGDRIRLKELHLNVSVPVSDTYNHCRIVVFQWNDSTQPIPQDVLQQIGGYGAVLSHYNYDNLKAKKLRVLMDRNLITSDAGERLKIAFMKKYTFPIRNVQFVSASPIVEKNAIYMLAITDSAVAPNPTVSFSSRLIYEDA